MAPEQRAPYLTARQMLDAAISERQFQAQIVQLAKLHGWMVSHSWLSVHSAAGWPDVIAVKDGRMLAIELKSERGKLTEAQEGWLDALSEVPGVQTAVFKPHDWAEIVRLLEG